jgi:glycosyltransferase involved in cell wall biosynthesis
MFWVLLLVSVVFVLAGTLVWLEQRKGSVHVSHDEGNGSVPEVSCSVPHTCPWEAAVVSLHRQRAEQQAARARLGQYRFQLAVDTRDASIYGRIRFPGEIGCALSHFAVLERVSQRYDRGEFDSHVLVLEDDVHFVAGYLSELGERVNRLRARVGDQWAFLRLGSSQYGTSPVGVDTGVSRDNSGTCGTFAILYNKRQLKSIVLFLGMAIREGLVEDAIDRIMARPGFQKILPSFSCTPPLAIADVRSSDIREGRALLAHSKKMGWPLGEFPTLSTASTRRFVVVVASYNNEDWVGRNIGSLLKQSYASFSVVYVDDASTDRTGELVRTATAGDPRFTYVRNTERMGQAYSRFRAYSACEPDSTCLLLDGDDWLAHEGVLAEIAAFMDDNHSDMVYNSLSVFENDHTDARFPLTRDYTPREKSDRSFRSAPWRATHPRVMEARLLQEIDPEVHLKFESEWMTVCTDMAESFVCLERARNPQKLELPRRSYVYNKTNSRRYSNSFYRMGEFPEERIKRAKVEAFVRSGGAGGL